MVKGIWWRLFLITGPQKALSPLVFRNLLLNFLAWTLIPYLFKCVSVSPVNDFCASYRSFKIKVKFKEDQQRTEINSIDHWRSATLVFQWYLPNVNTILPHAIIRNHRQYHHLSHIRLHSHHHLCVSNMDWELAWNYHIRHPLGHHLSLSDHEYLCRVYFRPKTSSCPKKLKEHHAKYLYFDQQFAH